MRLQVKRTLYFGGLIWALTLRELRRRYVGSVMGVFWSVIHPLITLTVWTFVFSYLLKVRFSESGGMTDFALYLFCGMIPFLAFQETVQNCTTSITTNVSLVKNLVFPSKAIQFSIAAAAMVSQCIGLGILVLAIVIVRGQFPILFPLTIPLAAPLMLFAIGLGWLTCTLHVFFRDTAQIVGVVMMVWLYGTPVFYPAHLVPSSLGFLMYVNPLAYTVTVFRSIVLNDTLPSLFGFVVFLAISLSTFVVGYKVYTRYYPLFVDEL